MDIVAVLGWSAAVTATILGIPQALRLIRTRDVEGVSLLGWQAMSTVNVGFIVHGILIHKANVIVPNALALVATLTVVELLRRGLHLSLIRAYGPGVAGALVLIGADLLAGSAAFGVLAVIPGVIAPGGMSVSLVRSPEVTGVSVGYLIMQVVNQVLWVMWAILVSDPGTIIAGSATGVIAAFNMLWYLARQAGLGAFFPAEHVSHTLEEAPHREPYDDAQEA